MLLKYFKSFDVAYSTFIENTAFYFSIVGTFILYWMSPSMFADLYRLFSKYAQWPTLPRVIPSMMMFGRCVVGDGSAV